MIQQFTRSSERHLYGGRDVMKNIFAILDFIYFILGLFTITVEAFLRRDFGERYFTRINFVGGWIFLGTWWFFVGGLFSLGKSFGDMEAATSEMGVMALFFFGYITISAVHFVGMWWRNRTDQPLHSLDSGNPWLLPLGKMMMGLVNLVSYVPIKLFAMSLSGEDKARLQKLLPLVPDSRGFTERILEPFFVMFLSIVTGTAGFGALTGWLFLTGVLLAARTNYRYETDRYQFLQIRDQILEAKHLPEAMAGASDVIRIPKSVRDTVLQTATQMQEDAPDMMEEIKQSHPTLADALAAVQVPKA